METTLKAGDSVILNINKQPPVVVTVLSVSPSGQVTVLVDGEKKRFKYKKDYGLPCNCTDSWVLMGDSYIFSKPNLYPNNPEILKILEDRYRNYLQDEERKETDRREKQEERNRIHNERLTFLKKKYNNLLPILNKQILSNEDRLYTIQVDPSEEQLNQDIIYNILIVRCAKNDQKWRIVEEEQEKIRFSWTYITSKGSSFSSIGEYYTDDEESALWDVIVNRFSACW